MGKGVPRYRARRDSNEAAIIGFLEACGWSVTRISAPGVPDLLMSKNGEWQVAEVKMPGKGLSDEQIDFAARSKAAIPVFRSRDDVYAWELSRKWRQ